MRMIWQGVTKLLEECLKMPDLKQNGCNKSKQQCCYVPHTVILLIFFMNKAAHMLCWSRNGNLLVERQEQKANVKRESGLYPVQEFQLSVIDKNINLVQFLGATSKKYQNSSWIKSMARCGFTIRPGFFKVF